MRVCVCVCLLCIMVRPTTQDRMNVASRRINVMLTGCGGDGDGDGDWGWSLTLLDKTLIVMMSLWVLVHPFKVAIQAKNEGTNVKESLTHTHTCQ